MARSASKAFEIADQQQSKVAARRQTRPADLIGVESLPECLDVAIEIRLVEDLIESRVKRVRRAPWQVLRGHPHRRLPRPAPSFAHRHRDTVVRRIIGVDPVSARLQDGSEAVRACR
jgi:hypothetical protein